jgi:hypothetical protein
VDEVAGPAYRDAVAEWLTVEVFDADFPATRWRRAHEDALIEAAVTNGASTWQWLDTRWGVVLELLFGTEEQLDRFRALPGVLAALDAVPDRVRGLVVYRGRGGGAGAAVPRRPRPAPVAAAAALPDPVPDQFLRLGLDDGSDLLREDRPNEETRPVGV